MRLILHWFHQYSVIQMILSQFFSLNLTGILVASVFASLNPSYQAVTMPRTDNGMIRDQKREALRVERLAWPR